MTGLVLPQYHCQYDDFLETTTGTQAISIPTSLWQYKAGLTDGKPEQQNEQTNQNHWEEQSTEDYYSSQENEEVIIDSEGEVMDNEEEDNPDLYVTRSGRKSKPPERLQYDAHSCLIHLNELENEETWSEQLFLAYKASTDPDTMYHHEAMKQRDRDKFQEAMKK